MVAALELGALIKSTDIADAWSRVAAGNEGLRGSWKGLSSPLANVYSSRRSQCGIYL